MKPEIRATVEYVLLHYSKELYNYTVEGVKATAHVPPGQQSEPGDWTTFLLEYIEQSGKSEFDDLKANLQAHKKKLIELERTLSAIHCNRMVQQENYEAFVAAQMGLENRLSDVNFRSLCQFMKTGISDEESQTVLEALIVISDLGKSPAIKDRAEAFGVNRALDTDDMMLAILNLAEDKIAEVVPRYRSLSVSAKQLLKQAYPLMTICFGHLLFLEGNSKVLDGIATVLEKMPDDPEQRSKVLKLVFAAQFFDGAGSQGQTFMYGSRTCTNDFYRGYMLMHETMETLVPVSSAQTAELSHIAFNAYLKRRAEWMALDSATFEKQEDFEVVLRLACTLRLFDNEMDKKAAEELKTAFYSLKSQHQTLLVEQLSLGGSGRLNRIARAPNYVATGAQNICRNAPGSPLSSADIKNVLNYSIVFARLIEKLWLDHSDVLAQPLLPLNFGGLAFLANDPMNFTKPDEFDLDMLLSKEPILPKATVKRVNTSTEKLKVATPDSFFQQQSSGSSVTGAAAHTTGLLGDFRL